MLLWGRRGLETGGRLGADDRKECQIGWWLGEGRGGA